MIRLKLTKLAENEINGKQLDQIKGGGCSERAAEAGWPFCFTKCRCHSNGHLRREHRIGAR